MTKTNNHISEQQETYLIDLQGIIPNDAKEGTWVGRVWVPESLDRLNIAGPHVVQIKDGQVYDLQDHVDSMSELINKDNPVQFIDQLKDLPLLCELEELLENSIFFKTNDKEVCTLLAPNDILAVKACGVTFIKSLLERVIEEQAGGSSEKADSIRKTITDNLGENLSSITPGSPETDQLKETLIKQGMWSQYLEVGIGKDAEVFTKHQVLASVTFGDEIGILNDSEWNNPEPEIVIVVSNKGNIVGATIGNDVNLRDYEGRSALLLGEAKDQNASCSIGPFIRLFDDSFHLEDVKNSEVSLSIVGKDGFATHGINKMCEISRSPEALSGQAIGENHQYPDGLVLFLGTMFAPTEDRGAKGSGFTHHIGDRVEISSPLLGKLVNWVNTCDRVPPWQYGITDWVNYLRKRDKAAH